MDSQTLRIPSDIGAAKLARPQSFWRRTGTVSAALFSAVVVKLSCPACWSTYAALLGASGVAGFAAIPYLFPLTLLSLLFVIVSLAYKARKRRGYKPLLLGLLGSGAILLGNFIFASLGMQNVGVVALVGASLWNSWPRSKQICPDCDPPETGTGKS